MFNLEIATPVLNRLEHFYGQGLIHMKLQNKRAFSHVLEVWLEQPERSLTFDLSKFETNVYEDIPNKLIEPCDCLTVAEAKLILLILDEAIERHVVHERVMQSKTLKFKPLSKSADRARAACAAA